MNGGNGARGAAAGGGEEVDGPVDWGHPGTIPWSRREGTTRRYFRSSSICSERLLAAATPGGRRRVDGGHRARVRVRETGENGEEWVEEREVEQVRVVVVYFLQGSR